MKTTTDIFIEEYQAEHSRFNDPDSRENQLLRQVTDCIAELTCRLFARQDLHDRLWQELAALPADHRPAVKPGRPIMSSSTRVIPAAITAPPEVAEAVTSGLATADASMAECRRQNNGLLGRVG